MSTQITTQKILAFDEYADFGSLPGIEGYIYIDNSANIAYLWDSVANTYVNIGGEPEPPIPPDPIPLLFVDAATAGVITPTPNYTNGVAGVGATLIGGVNGALTDGTAPGKIDLSYTPTAGDIILVKDQTVSTTLSSNKAFQNGVYLIVNPGSSTSKYELLRLPDYDTSTGLYPLQVNATGGSNNITRYFIQTTINPQIGINNGTTGNLAFPVTTGQSVSLQIAFVDTVIDTTLPTSVYANGTAFPTVPGNGATLTATAFGPLGTHNGLTATLDNNSVTGFRRALVINQPGANAAYNGDYSVIRPGSIYTSAAGATSVGTTINVTSVTGLVVGMTVTVLSGTGAFAANTTVTSINTTLNRFVVSIAPTTPLSGGATVVRAGTTWQLRRIQTGAGGFDRYTRFFMVSNTGSTKAGKYYFTTPNAAPLTNNSSLAPFNTGIGIAPINIVEYGGSSSVGPFGIANSSGVYTYYATMTLAMAAATSGQTIEVFADYTENTGVTVTLKDGVNINGNGHTYTFVGTLAGQSAFSIANASIVNSSISNYTITASNSSGGACLFLNTNLSGKLILTGSVFKITGPSAMLIITNSATSNIDIIDLVGYSTAVGIILSSSPSARIVNAYIYSSLKAYEGNANVYDSTFISINGIGIYNSGNVYNSTGTSSAEYGIQSIGGILDGCTGYSSTKAGIYVLYSNAYNCFGYSTSSYGIRFDNQPCRGYNCLGYSTADNGIRMYYLGLNSDLELYDSTAISTAATAFYWEGFASNMTCISEHNNSGSHAAEGANNAVINASRLIVANTGANCLYKATAVTQKYAQCAFKGATTPVNANIIQGMTNFEDAFGNIKI